MRGTKGTFLVRVLYREKNSWQGEVLWAEQNQHRTFRNKEELLKWMDESMDQYEKKTNVVSRHELESMNRL